MFLKRFYHLYVQVPRLIVEAVIIVLLIVVLSFQLLHKEKMAYVDSTKLLSNYKAMVDDRKDFEVKSKQWQSNIDTLMQDVQRAIHQYEKDAAQGSEKEKKMARELKIMIMKKKFLAGVLLIATMVASYFFYKEYSLSPLKQEDFQKLFKGNNGSFSKSCSKDFLGTSFHSELFEIYQYTVRGAVVNKDFPNITEWEGKLVTNEVIVGKWKNCPIDTQTMNLYKFTLNSNDFEKVECCSSFNQEILNARNYYSFVHFNDLEQYFLLYCPDRNELYYIRRKGF